ncbi:shootin-1-like [Artemia franciscana]|uniref:Uncharacterized protein n=1 Tax=Artemia franciscana TaxID=6661 RepID=A0AA88HUB9_ARTSF|nr:hypothetical protein QYM36_011030 [Artemia franciscana]
MKNEEGNKIRIVTHYGQKTEVNTSRQLQIDPRDISVKIPQAQLTQQGHKNLLESIIERNVRNKLQPNALTMELDNQKRKSLLLEMENAALRKKVMQLEEELRGFKIPPPPPPPPPSTPYTPATPKSVSSHPLLSIAHLFKFKTRPSEKKKKYRRASYPSIDTRELDAFEEAVGQIKQGKYSLKHIQKEDKKSLSGPTSPESEEFRHVIGEIEHKREKRLSGLSLSSSSSTENLNFGRKHTLIRSDGRPSSPGIAELNSVLKNLQENRIRHVSGKSTSSESSRTETRPNYRTVVRFTDEDTDAKVITSGPSAIGEVPRLFSPELVTAVAQSLADIGYDNDTPATCSEWNDEEVTYF